MTTLEEKVAFARDLWDGKTVEQDRIRGAEVFKMAADEGSAEAALEYGLIVSFREYVKKAVDAGYVRAYPFYAITQNDGEKFIKLWEEAATPEDRLWYAGKLANEQSTHQYKIVADSGDARGCLEYALAVAAGKGIERDSSEAAKYFKTWEERASALDKFTYAERLANGDGMPQNILEAVKYYKAAADGGNAEGCIRYSEALLVGNGINQDLTESAVWLQKWEKMTTPAERCDHARRIIDEQLPQLIYPEVAVGDGELVV
jgi:TPR repeat protein